jgi:uncharacterized protein (TIGR03437 family)
MSLYELDPNAPDDLIQTMYFPPASVDLRCDVWGCEPAGSAWLQPLSYDSPFSPPKVFAEMATVVNWGTFIDPGRACSVSQALLNAVSAASLVGPALAPESIATLFGEGLAVSTVFASTHSLPASLAGTAVRITDRSGARRLAPLFFASPSRIDFQVPAGTALGPASIAVIRGESVRDVGQVQIEAAVPALFAANADGKGVAGAMVVRTRPDGSRTSELAFNCGVSDGTCVSVPIDVGTDELGSETAPPLLVLYGTGIRNASTQPVIVSIGDETPEIVYAGPQGDFVGLDQVSVELPRALMGRGEVDVAITVDGKQSNSVTINVR